MKNAFAMNCGLRDIAFERQKEIPLEYKGVKLDCGYRIDLIADHRIVIELKCVEKLMPIHDAQILTYMRLSKLRVGLLLNFNSAALKDQIKRLVL